MIEESKILEFIQNHDKRRGAKLDKYKEIIIRLLGYGISKKEIYNFIKQEDENIGSQINFYKYISRNIQQKPKKNTKLKPTSTKQSFVPKKSEVKKRIISNNKTDILKQNFNLMDYED